MHWIYTFLKCKGDKVLIAQVTIFAVVFIGLMLAYFVAKHKNIEISNKFYKILSLVLAVVFFFRFMLGHDEIGNVFALAKPMLAITYSMIATGHIPAETRKRPAVIAAPRNAKSMRSFFL